MRKGAVFEGWLFMIGDMIVGDGKAYLFRNAFIGESIGYAA